MLLNLAAQLKSGAIRRENLLAQASGESFAPAPIWLPFNAHEADTTGDGDDEEEFEDDGGRDSFDDLDDPLPMFSGRGGVHPPSPPLQLPSRVPSPSVFTFDAATLAAADAATRALEVPAYFDTVAS